MDERKQKYLDAYEALLRRPVGLTHPILPSPNVPSSGIATSANMRALEVDIARRYGELLELVDYPDSALAVRASGQLRSTHRG